MWIYCYLYPQLTVGPHYVVFDTLNVRDISYSMFANVSQDTHSITANIQEAVTVHPM